MGRPSKLTPQQWAEIERRLLAGETARALGREFAVSETAIRKKFGANQSVSLQSSQVRTAAQMLAQAHLAVQALPPGQREIAVDLSETYRSTMASLAAGAETSAKTFHRLTALANAELQKVDDANLAGSEGSLRVVAGLTKMANEAAATPVSMLSNRERMRPTSGEGGEDDPEKPKGVLVVPGLMSDTAAWSQQAQAGTAKGGE